MKMNTVKENTYYYQVLQLWFATVYMKLDNRTGKQLANELKRYIINDLTKIGVNVLDINFYVEMSGFSSKTVNINFKNKFTNDIFLNYTREQLTRKYKIDMIL